MFATVRYNNKLQLCYSVDEIICESNTAIDIVFKELSGNENPLNTEFEVYIDTLSKQFNGVLCNGVKNTPWGASGYIVFEWGMLEIQQCGPVRLSVNHLRNCVVIELCI